jgi:hypothetical protein
MIRLRAAAKVSVLVLGGALAGAGCGTVDKRAAAPAAAEPVRFEAHGLSVALPPRWRPARANLTPALSDPREVLAVATYALRYRRTTCAHVAGSALEDLGPDDAFVTLQERGLDPGSAWSDFPERPARFGPELGGPSEASACVPRAHFRDHWFGFTAAGRHFHADVAFGTHASAETRAQAWAILDSLRVDPHARPHWPSSG